MGPAYRPPMGDPNRLMVGVVLDAQHRTRFDRVHYFMMPRHDGYNTIMARPEGPRSVSRRSWPAG